MKRQPVLATLLLWSLIAPSIPTPHVVGQQQAPRPAQTTPARPPADQPRPSQSPNTASGDEVVQITTNLVQVDAVVTDRDGRQVTDLQAEDFEILENGKPQPITNFSYVALAAAVTTAPPAPSRTGTAAPPPPPVRLRPGQVRRTIALVVDDYCLSFESIGFVRKALRRYVDRQMDASDLVAIIRTKGGDGALQQFTSDKRQLYAAIERVRWNPSFINTCANPLAPINPLDAQEREATASVSEDSDIENANRERESIANFGQELSAVAALSTLNFVVRGLHELPGRKAVVLFSDGLPLFTRMSAAKGGAADSNQRVFNGMARLIDLANRASVVIYTLHASGLQPLQFTAADNISGAISSRGDMTQFNQLLSERRAGFNDSQEGLAYLAKETGGIAVRNTNDLSGGIERVLNDQRGYYLIGYRPDEKSFDPITGLAFNEIKIKLKNQRNLSVRTRSGFYPKPTEEARPVPRTRGEQLLAAIRSPLATGDVNLRLTSLFGNDAQAGSFLRSLLYIEPGTLTFTGESDGWHKAVMDIAALTFDGDGRVIDTVNRTETIRARGDALEQLQRAGLTHLFNVPVTKAGAYQLRVAVRDVATERTGSAGQFIEIPDLNKDRIALSGIVLQGSANDPAPVKIGGAEEESNVQANPAVRRFRANTTIEYGYQIYNTKLDPATNRPQLQTQVRLFRDGQQVFTGKLLSFDASRQSDMKRLSAGGRMQLGATMPPGEYVLQIVITDLLAKGNRRTVQQWIDFEIMK